jgi:nucleoside-diphosphate-sugar epimerase
MRILVTGHRGYIGSVMVPMLVGAGHEVVGIDSDLFRDCATAPSAREVPELALDIRDVELVQVEGFEAVVHLAALSKDPLSDLNPEITDEINHRASVRLAELAKEAGARRFLFSSSCSVYGRAGVNLVDETSESDPATPYNISKALVERELRNLADDGFSPTFLRNATAYGLSPRHDFDLVLNNLVAWAHTEGRVHIKSDGSPWRPVVHVEDISRAFLAALEAPREVVHNETLNVGRSEENYRIRDLAEIVGDVVTGSTVEYATDGNPPARSYRVDFSKIQRLLPEFKPEWDARRGAEQLHTAYGAMNLALDEFEGPRYKRVDHLKQLVATGRVDSTLRWRESPVLAT